jgi:zinc-ribbon family
MEITFIIYGKKRTPIGLYEFDSYQCPQCEKVNTTYAVIYSMYFHIFWIPFFPDHKLTVATCSECSFIRGTEKFGPNLLEQSKGLTKKYRLLLLLTVILTIIIDAIL